MQIYVNIVCILTTGETPLHLAARHSRADAAKKLLDGGASAVAQDNCGRTPLHAAIGADARGVFQVLYVYCYWSRCSRRLSGTLFPMLEASFRYFMFNLVMQFYMYTHAWLVWLNQPISVMKNLLELVKWAFKGSGFYPPKSRVKIGLIPPPLPEASSLPTSTSCHQKTFWGKMQCRCQNALYKFYKKIFPLFFTGRRLSEPTMYRDRRHNISLVTPNIVNMVVRKK